MDNVWMLDVYLTLDNLLYCIWILKFLIRKCSIWIQIYRNHCILIFRLTEISYTYVFKDNKINNYLVVSVRMLYESKHSEFYIPKMRFPIPIWLAAKPVTWENIIFWTPVSLGLHRVLFNSGRYIPILRDSEETSIFLLLHNCHRHTNKLSF